MKTDKIKTEPITISIRTDLIDYIDTLAAINGRSRSAMISWIISKEKAADEALDEEAAERGENA